MALQSSGLITMSQIYAEVVQQAHNGSTTISLNNIGLTADQYGGGFNTTNPDSMSEFYGWAYYYPPVVSTGAVTGVTTNSATFNGTLTSWGSVAPEDKGFYIGTSGTPTSNTRYTVAGTATGAYSLVLSSLSANTLYYVNAFAKTSGRPEVVASQTFFTTTSTAACEVIVSAFSSTAQGACIGNTRNYRYDTTNFSAATWVRSGVDTTCQGAYQSAGYFSNGSIWRYWNGSSFTSSGGCA